MLNPRRRPDAGERDDGQPSQRGQALILVALAFVGLAAFIGLAVDAGILFTDHRPPAPGGRCRLALGGQPVPRGPHHRPARPPRRARCSALNGLNAGLRSAWQSRPHDANPGDVDAVPHPDRTQIRSGAAPICPSTSPSCRSSAGTTVTIHANAISEAASIDIVLTIDTSESQAYDAACGNGTDDDEWAEINLGPGVGDGTVDDGCGGNPVAGSFPDDYMRDPDNCNGVKQCRPFRDVQDAAVSLTTRLLPPYDRMAIVTFDRNAGVPVNLGSGHRHRSRGPLDPDHGPRRLQVPRLPNLRRHRPGRLHLDQHGRRAEGSRQPVRPLQT